jgi:hypothetical protein
MGKNDISQLKTRKAKRVGETSILFHHILTFEKIEKTKTIVISINTISNG